MECIISQVFTPKNIGGHLIYTTAGPLGIRVKEALLYQDQLLARCDQLCQSETLNYQILFVLKGSLQKMSSMIEEAQSQWLAQLASMRQAIADLKLDISGRRDQGYGHDMVLDDDDFTGGSGSDDIWDIISEEEDDNYSSDHLESSEEPQISGDNSEVSYGKVWLHEKTTTFANRRSGLDASQLQGQILALLASDSQGDLQQAVIFVEFN